MADTTPKFNLKYGKLSELEKMALSVGTISVTTDTHSMYIDLPVKDDTTGTTETKRFRVSDFETYANLKELADNSKNWYVGSLALIENVDDVDGEENKPSQAPILAYYNGTSWININDTKALKERIEKVYNDGLSLATYVENVSGRVEDLEETVGDKSKTTFPFSTESTLWSALNSLYVDLFGEEGNWTSGYITELEDLQASVGEQTADDKDDLWTTVRQLSKDIEDILGTGTDGDPTSIAGLNKKIEDETDRAKAAEESLDGRIDVIEGDYLTSSDKEALSNRIGVIEGDYLKNEDKEALSERIDGIEEDYLKNADKEDLEAANTSLSNRIGVIEGDYLKKADKDALSGRISTIEGDYLKKADKEDLEAANATLSGKIQTLLGGVNEPDKGQSVRDIAIDELAKQLIPENAAESLDTLQEIAAWIQEHPEDAADMNEKILTLEGILTGLGPNEEDPYKTVMSFVNAVKAELVTEITKVNNQFYWQPFTTTTTE